MIWDLMSYADNTAVIGENGDIFTYSELYNMTKELETYVDKRSLVMCLCKNEIGSLLGYVTFLNCGGVPLMVSDGLDNDSRRELIKKYRPDYIWYSSGRETIEKYTEVYNLQGYSLAVADERIDHNMYEELALLLTTSGSTGSPKFVRQSYKNIISNTESIIEYLKIDVSERAITTLPMNYTYGLSIINTHLYAGATIILTDKTIMQREFWSLFKEHKATSFGGVPYIYEMLDKLRFFRMDLPHLRTMTQAGGKLSPELHKKFAEYALENGKNFVVMYGQTEATARMAYLPPERALDKYGSMGIAIPKGQLYLVDDEGNVIEDNDVVGELVYEGDNVTLGYAQSLVDLSKGDEWNGRNVTGDMAKRDEEGFYYITGRKKRFLKIFGNRVNLDEVEQMIKLHFKGTDFACGGVDDKMKVYVADEGNADKIRSFLAEKLSLNVSAFKIVRVDKIPRSDSGKVLYNELENNG